MEIYMNGKLTNYENIFDLLAEKNICPWYYVSSDLIGRNLGKVLDDWTNTDKTYYYVDGKRYDFELK